uniref:Capsid protein n=1 Tax=Cruciviridae sp. TaxID=1955495 RepID=A0A1S6LVI3_9VIRU|nr:capsid protein [Cruciviridae sp.]
MAMIPKAQYMKLSKKAKLRVKAALARTGYGSRVSPAKMFGKLGGKGDYWRLGGKSGAHKVKDSSRGAGSQIGRGIGSWIHKDLGDLGSAAGGWAHSLFKQLTGFGDYKIKKNTIAMGTDPPTFGGVGRGTNVRHREFLGDVYTSSTPGSFSEQSFPINPALPDSFPWLSQTACCFEQYVINGMVYEFKSTSSDALNSTNTALGTVIMATQYNVLLPLFTSKGQMENHEYATSAKPSVNLLHPLECDTSMTPTRCFYTRQGSIATGDLRLYDMGTFQIATTGFQAPSVNIGELWCTYDVTFLKAQIKSNGSQGGPFADHFILPAATISPASPLSIGSVLQPGSNNGCTINAGGTVLTFPQSEFDCSYMLYYAVYGTAATITGIVSQTLGSNVFVKNLLINSTTYNRKIDAGSISDWQGMILTCTVKASPSTTNNTITFNNTISFPTAITGGDLIVTYLPDNIVTGEKPIRGPVVFRDGERPYCEDSKEDDEDSEDDDFDYEAALRMMLKRKTKAKVSKPEGKSEKKEDDEDDEDYSLSPLKLARESTRVDTGGPGFALSDSAGVPVRSSPSSPSPPYPSPPVSSKRSSNK